MKMVFFDMDGVLYNLEGGLTDMYDLDFSKIDRTSLFKSYLPEYVERDGFYNQEPLRGAEQLVQGVLSLREQTPFNIGILTSSGHFATNSDVIQQKKAALERDFKELYYFPFTATTSSKQKALFAHKNAFLIDDYNLSTTSFIAAGGHAFQYTPEKIDECLECLEMFLDNRFV